MQEQEASPTDSSGANLSVVYTLCSNCHKTLKKDVYEQI